MSSKLFIFAFISFECITNWGNCDFTTSGDWGKPNVTGLTPNVSIFETTYLYNTDINLLLTVYQLPVNRKFKQTLRVLRGSTNVDSAGRCIAYSVSFEFLGQYPIKDNQATGNGGCDAILGRKCSQAILNALQESFKDINSHFCGTTTSHFFPKTPTECPRDTLSYWMLLKGRFLHNNSFFVHESSPTDLSATWGYAKSDPSIDGNYDELIKYFVFIYFVGRSYSMDTVDTAIACLSAYKTVPQPISTTAQPTSTKTKHANTATRISTSENFLIWLSLSYVFSQFIVY